MRTVNADLHRYTQAYREERAVQRTKLLIVGTMIVIAAVTVAIISWGG